VQHAIVEGEPGIFPDPVARVMRAIGGWFGRRKDQTDETQGSRDPRGPAGTDDTEGTDAPPETARDTRDAGDDPSGEST
jgi:hypothetical protein